MFYKISLFFCVLFYSMSTYATGSVVDLNKYVGVWYEQARLPNSFQKHCLASTATYSLNDDGTIKVVNTCVKADGTKLSNTGKGVVDSEDSTNRSLTVSFNFITDIVNFFQGVNYYIYDVDDNYTYAIVGTPNTKMMWILTRSEILDKESMDDLINKAKKYGFDTSKTIFDQR